MEMGKDGINGNYEIKTFDKHVVLIDSEWVLSCRLVISSGCGD
jgi:hypothetical protein